jgi:hypothetical protein
MLTERYKIVETIPFDKTEEEAAELVPGKIAEMFQNMMEYCKKKSYKPYIPTLSLVFKQYEPFGGPFNEVNGIKYRLAISMTVVLIWNEKGGNDGGKADRDQPGAV